MNKLYILNTKQGNQDKFKPVTEYYYEVKDKSTFDSVMEECVENSTPYVLESSLGKFITGFDHQLKMDIKYLTKDNLDEVFKEQQDRFYQAKLLNVVNNL